MTQAYNLSQLANNLNTSGQLDATDGLVNAVPPANGGTGQATYTIGDILYASGATALAKLSDIATGNVLISGGVGAAPSYGKVGLTTHISGTLAVGNGGTGAASFVSNNVLLGNGSGTFQVVAPGTTGNVLTSNGTTWASAAAPASVGVGQTWQNLTGSRAIGTTYTNSTGKPIMVNVWCSNSGVASSSATLTVGGIGVSFVIGDTTNGGSGATLSAIVPNGDTYSVATVNRIIGFWTELR
jgi:hypothetical protein